MLTLAQWSRDGDTAPWVNAGTQSGDDRHAAQPST
jgi:hypothetical protein